MAEQTCISCGRPISDNPDYSRTCDGKLYDAPNPYAIEIQGDYEDYYECDTTRAICADDI